MQALLAIAVANAVAAAALAVVAWAAARWVRRPALTHALCVVVLLKLVTPPLVEAPLYLPSPSPELLNRLDVLRGSSVDWANMAQIAAAVWLAGAVGWFGLQVRFASRLRAALDCATPAPPAVADMTARLARQMGLRRHPPVRMLSAAHSPMLCGMGPGVRIVLPAEMLERLSPAAQETIIAHELAHYARRDHWVRIVEVLATGCFWWHPAVWWTRRQIESAEEQCCDALVVQRCAVPRQTYAEAILDMIDWLAERRRTTSSLLASAFGGRTELSDRLRDLLDRDLPPRASRWGESAIAIVAAACLFIRPSVAWVSSNGPSMATATEGLDLAAASSQTDAPREVVAREKPVWATAISPRGDYAVSVRPGFRCELTHLATGRVRTLQRRQIACMVFVADGAAIVVGDRDGSVSLIDAETGEEMRRLVSASNPIGSLDASAASNLVAAADDQGHITIASLAPDEALATWKYDAPIRCLRFSPDGRRLAIAFGSWRDASPSRIEIVDAASREVVQHWVASQPLGAVRFASDDGLLTADWSGLVECRRIADGRRIGSVNAPKELVSAEAFSPHVDALAPLARQFDAIMRRASAR